ncbi:hypothetical protein BC938DRAFT_477494 [Jimgerdemannia flammicorona]|uniref:Uncharacterized protein n=1 Tax=Jimgerdemannia flammicorona TaxID=994334 RepID=A0A433QP92_9FUNG|nr:hypothetical protein BC938DRAFT_477494 [Jimgerdemannia flammicorona]
MTPKIVTTLRSTLSPPMHIFICYTCEHPPKDVAQNETTLYYIEFSTIKLCSRRYLNNHFASH